VPGGGRGSMRERWQAELARISTRNLIGSLGVIALAGCGQPGGLPVQAADPRWTQDPHWRQVDLDVAAIIGGMTLAHGVRAVALAPEQ
jgi:hypothetical protein